MHFTRLTARLLDKDSSRKVLKRFKNISFTHWKVRKSSCTPYNIHGAR